MEKKSRFELIKIVEAQKEQLVRYETRLRGKEMLHDTTLHNSSWRPPCTCTCMYVTCFVSNDFNLIGRGRNEIEILT